MNSPAQTLLAMLDLQKNPAATDEFIGSSYDFVGRRIFGGQVLAQALMASSLTTDKPCHSLHAYFLVGGDIRYPVHYEVLRLRDGRSLSARQITAVQYINGARQVIFGMLSSHAPMQEAHYQNSLTYQKSMPSYPKPETLKTEQQLKQEQIHSIAPENQERFLREREVLIKPINPKDPVHPHPTIPRQAVWLCVPDIKDQPIAIHQALLAFSSDYYLIGTSLLSHGLTYQSPNMQMASIDHSLHFHRPFDISQWLLYDMKSDVTGYDRGLNLGQFWQDGALVASASQEGLIRQKKSI